MSVESIGVLTSPESSNKETKSIIVLSNSLLNNLETIEKLKTELENKKKMWRTKHNELNGRFRKLLEKVELLEKNSNEWRSKYETLEVTHKKFIERVDAERKELENINSKLSDENKNLKQILEKVYELLFKANAKAEKIIETK